MLTDSPGARRRGLWITVSALAVAGLVGTLITVLRSDDPRPAALPAPGVSPSTPGSSPVPKLSVERPSGVVTETGPPLPGVAPDDSVLVGGMTNHLQFARTVAQALLVYDAGTDFTARNTDLLRAAAPTPYGNPVALRDDLTAFTPTGAALESIRATDTTVTVSLSDVAVSAWAARKLAARGASSGVHGVDITGAQTISTNNAGPLTVPIRMGVTVACPPAVAFCTVDRVFPQHLQDALATG